LINPTISVVTPSFNKGRFIDETIRSVISQEGDFYLEYLIMDGGSTDDSVDIIKKYDRLIREGKWPLKCRSIEYRWVSEKDKGQSDAINKGFRAAKGDIVAWLNADDTYLPGAIEKAAAYFTRHPDVIMVYGEGYEIDEKGEVIQRFPATQPFNLWGLIYVRNYILQPSVFMRRWALLEAGLLDQGLNWCMDWELWIRMGKKYKVEYIPEFLGTFRMYGDIKTNTGGLKRFRELVRTFRKHGKRRFPPAYFIYGHDTLTKVVSIKAPLLYRLFLKYVMGFFILALYRLYLDRKVEESMSCRHADNES
jgi:glycosyltransferase involved in cell wall biosynthesis